MYDYGISTLKQYGLTVQSSSRTRGALLCRTDSGLLILREFYGSEKKLQFQQELLQILQREGCPVDVYLENQTGSYISRDKDNIPYTLQKWYDGRECDTKSVEDIKKSVEMLAKIHKFMKMPEKVPYIARSLEEEYTRHNCELRKIRKYIRKKGASSEFEKLYLKNAEWFLEKGEQALTALKASGYEALRKEALLQGCFCHGEFNQHNVLLWKNETIVTNFDHLACDVQIVDLYHFMRKILEKYNWDVRLARKMLEIYHEIRNISPAEWENLKIRFSYPEKFWKLANYYYCHNKAWISEKNTQKLGRVISQKEIWESFPSKCFGKSPF